MKRSMKLDAYAPRPAHLNWLLEGDPSIRWQVMQDLCDEPGETVAAERARVAREGWGAKILAYQSPEGHFGGKKEDHGLMVTLYTLVVLKELGLDPESPEAKRLTQRIEGLVFRQFGSRPFFTGEVEPCINGRILSVGAYFKKPSRALAKQLLSEQLKDGGWNCEAPTHSHCSSFHTTICVLEGLLDYERLVRRSPAITAARKRAEEYLLKRRLFRSLRTGKVIEKRWQRFAYPPFWHYDVLRGLEYFRQRGGKPDAMLTQAIDTVIARRHQNGRWPLNVLHAERLPVPMETKTGHASRWNSLRALRVLRWYAGGGKN
ncbi:MAG TPA: hypothetical protein VGI93_01635 [Steroidobacteraceae bacterium]|jgi:hypothetical protein